MIQFRTICLSAHLDSFCRELDKRCGLEFVYQTGNPGATRLRFGWKTTAAYRNGPITLENTARAEKCDLLIEMMREIDLMSSRCANCMKTVYISERWFKPIPLLSLRLVGRLVLIRLPGVVRLLSLRYRKMARQFVKLMDNSNFYVFPCGVHAARDFAQMYGILHGKLHCWFRRPDMKIERTLGGSIEGFPRMKLWGYFVEPSNCSCPSVPKSKDSLLRILWVGRMLNWKRVDTLIRAFKIVAKKRPAALLLVGEGPERKWLEKLSGNAMCVNGEIGWVEGKILFHDYIESDKVRQLMRMASVYVMPSNAEEGWGAAVSDALAEECYVLASRESGSSSALLPEHSMFRSGNVRELASLLVEFKGKVRRDNKNVWSGVTAAGKLLELVN